MKVRHAATLALVGWALILFLAPGLVLAGSPENLDAHNGVLLSQVAM